jgi:rhodanese-related sulfurtransferase
MGIFKNLFKQNKINFSELIKNGATIIDVRTPAEFNTGHAPGSVNIPLDKLASQMNSLPTGKPIITCCASGMRSAAAKGMLKRAGFIAENAGRWQNVNTYLP